MLECGREAKSGLSPGGIPAWRGIICLTVLLSLAPNSLAQLPQTGNIPKPAKELYNPPYPNNPVEPYRLIGNIYYIGLTNYTSFLITTPQGHFLLDTLTEPMVPELVRKVEALGFKLQDIKYLLQAHAHSDHVGGLAKLKEMTGAPVLVMEQDAEVLADGGRTDFRSNGEQIWTPVRADRILRDGEKLELGGVTMVAHLTAGHTKGCTTWTTQVQEAGRTYNVVFFCSSRVNDGLPLINNPKYPTMAEDFWKGFQKLKTLPCDVPIASHAFMFNMEPKLARLKGGASPNPFIDVQGCKDYVADFEHAFLYELQEQRAGKPPSDRRPGAASRQ